MTAECYEDSRPHCQSKCSWDEIFYGTETGECANFDMGNGSCMGDFEGSQTGCSNGDICYLDDFEDLSGWYQKIPGTCISFYRFYYCDGNSEQEQCPNGFSCQGLSYGDGTYTDPVCLGDCPFYLENGFIRYKKCYYWRVFPFVYDRSCVFYVDSDQYFKRG